MEYRALKNEDEKPGVYYHYAPSRIRESILKHGLDPSKFDMERSTQSKGPYLFNNYTTAWNYANYMSSYRPVEPFDIWEVTGLWAEDLKPDWGLYSDQEEDEGSREYDSSIPPSQIRLKTTVGREYREL